MSQERIQELVNTFLVLTGTSSSAVAITIDGITDLIACTITVATFICYFLMNQEEIKSGWKKFKNKVKNGFK